MKVFITVLLLFCLTLPSLSQKTWEDVLLRSAQKDVSEAVFLVTKLELTNGYIKGESNLIKLDIAKSSAYNNSSCCATSHWKGFSKKLAATFNCE